MSVNGLMNQTITIASKSGYDAYGRVTTSTETTIKARVQQTTKQKFLANGDVILISAIAYVPSDTTVEIDDAVTVGSREYSVYGKYEAVDGGGRINHIRLELT